jgi:pimeloyl-ACP methyl ester carboxylesterase
MGGMIAQELAIRMPQRVTTLTSIMSTPGDPALARHSPGAAQFLATPVPTDRASYIKDAIRRELWLGGDTHPTDEDLVRERVSRGYDRSFEPGGVARQALAVLASPDRTAALAQIDVPTLVVHGDADPLVNVKAGEATAAAIPGARMVVVAGMGHALRPAVWLEVTEAVCAHVLGAAATARSSQLSEAAA